MIWWRSRSAHPPASRASAALQLDLVAFGIEHRKPAAAIRAPLDVRRHGPSLCRQYLRTLGALRVPRRVIEPVDSAPAQRQHLMYWLGSAHSARLRVLRVGNFAAPHHV